MKTFEVTTPDGRTVDVQAMSADEAIAKVKSGGMEYGAGRAALQGLTMGFADEIEAFARPGNYSDNLSKIGAAKQAYESANPGTALAAELAGSIPTMLLGGAGLIKGGATLLSKAPQAAAAIEGLSPMASRVLASSVSGAGQGAITGAGTSREGERTSGALAGGGIGAAVGTTLPMLGRGVGGVAQGMVDKSQGIPVLGAIGQAAGKYIPGLTDNFGERADLKLLQAIKQDNLSPEQMSGSLTAMSMGPRPPSAKPMTLTDVGGKNVLGLADVASTYPGQSQARAAALQAERQGGQLQRVGTDLAGAFKALGKGTVPDLSMELKQAREVAAGPLYQRAFAEGANLNSPELIKLFSRPSMMSGYKTAQNFAKEQGLPPLPDISNLARTGIDLKTMNMIKQGLDDVIFSAKQPGSNIGKLGLGYMNDTRVSLLKELDALVPSYAQARMAFAGPAALNEALETGAEFGKGLATKSVADLKSEIRKLGDSEKEHFMIGVFDSMRNNMSKSADGRDLIKVVYGSNEKRQIIKELVGPEFGQLEYQMMREQVMRRTDDTIRGNSATARRTAGQNSLEAETGLVPSIAEKGAMRGVTDYILRSATGPGQATADALSSPLFSTNLGEQLATLNRLSSMDKLLKDRAVKQGVKSGVLSGQFGLLGD